MLANQKGVTISNPSRWPRKIERFQSSRVQGLKVISDWDRTLTAPHSTKGLDQSTYSFLYNSNLLGSQFRYESKSLYDTYRKIELSSEMQESEKCAKMDEWWSAQFDLLIEYGFSDELISRLLEGDRLTMREGAWAFLKRLSKNGVPILVLSAGIANVIEAQLRLHGANTPNLHISANALSMNQLGIATDHNRPLIHTLNKTSYVPRSGTFSKATSDRPNLLLLGDTVEDVRMKQVTSYANTISIGFLCDSNLHSQFIDAYDAVVAPDGSLEIVNRLLDTIE